MYHCVSWPPLLMRYTVPLWVWMLAGKARGPALISIKLSKILLGNCHFMPMWPFFGLWGYAGFRMQGFLGVKHIHLRKQIEYYSLLRRVKSASFNHGRASGSAGRSQSSSGMSLVAPPCS